VKFANAATKSAAKLKGRRRGYRPSHRDGQRRKINARHKTSISINHKKNTTARGEEGGKQYESGGKQRIVAIQRGSVPT